MKKEQVRATIAEYVGGFISYYYPDQQEGQFCGDADALADYVADQTEGEDNEIDSETALAEIKEMINDGSLEEDSIEWPNPENDQHTVYVDIITVKGFQPEESDFINIRKSQSYWGYRYPDSWKSYDKNDFASFKENLVSEIEDVEMRGGSKELTSDEVSKWQSWDDVEGHETI